jgi:hypothetical protein
MFVPPITVKFPDAPILNFVLSYFNDIVFDVFKKDLKNLNCFVLLFIMLLMLYLNYKLIILNL